MPAASTDGALPRVVLTPAELDLLELADGAPVALAVARARVGDVGAVELTDGENTPLARVHLGHVDEAADALPVTGLERLRPLAPVPGPSGAEGTRLGVRDAAERYQGRGVVVLREVPTRDELDAAVRWSVAQDPATGPVWFVGVSRDAAGATDPAHTAVRVLTGMIADGDLPGDLLVVALPHAPGPALVPVRPLPTDAELAQQATGGPVLELHPARSDAPPGAPATALERALAAIYPPRAVAELSPRDRSGRGAVVLFTGLSGSGKSTVAKAFAHRLESEGRTVVLLDGDESRQMLSAGLGFDRRSRDLNIERLGYVATIASSLGAVAVTAPIAPFAGARERVRERAEQVGDHLLVHVSTPLEVCEARDRKGLYAQARAGRISDFTGISSPYEEPQDADVTIDTSRLSVEDAVEAVHAALVARQAG